MRLYLDPSTALLSSPSHAWAASSHLSGMYVLYCTVGQQSHLLTAHIQCRVVSCHVSRSNAECKLMKDEGCEGQKQYLDFVAPTIDPSKTSKDSMYDL